MHAVWTSENTRGRDHHAQRGEEWIEVEKDYVASIHVASHQQLSDLYAGFGVQTLELARQVPKDNQSRAEQDPALHLGGTPHPVEARLSFSLILVLNIHRGGGIKEVKIHMRESTLI